MRHGFGLNTDLFETNVLNLIVVVGIVVTFVGDALRDLLDQRRKVILSTLQEADKKASEAQNRLEEAKKSVETARLRTQEILDQASKTAEQESFFIQEQFSNDLKRLQDRSQQGIQLERQRTVQSIAQQVANLALITAESTLFTSLGSQGPTLLKQKELNEMHVRETFRSLKVWSSSIQLIEINANFNF
jgi:F-type H+-transporting ATPase subunit b